uniref:IDEAL domain-containing protein n=1 Tax=Caenorhabditis tropicalis TaxID=1561998 RepID=A0A1I7U8S2_9PELO
MTSKINDWEALAKEELKNTNFAKEVRMGRAFDGRNVSYEDWRTELSAREDPIEHVKLTLDEASRKYKNVKLEDVLYETMVVSQKYKIALDLEMRAHNFLVQEINLLPDWPEIERVVAENGKHQQLIEFQEFLTVNGYLAQQSTPREPKVK